MRIKVAVGGLSSLLLATAVVALASFTLTSPTHAAPAQDPTLFYYEVQTIFLMNQQRRAAGVPPLRWNRELTQAARQFAMDAVENHPPRFCNHIDSAGRDPGQRMRDAGYIRQSAWAENAVCGRATPEAVIAMWMASAPHRANILNPTMREAGVGYYCSGDRCYTVADLSVDRDFAPAMIENEALTTYAPTVSVYIYDQFADPGLIGVGRTTEILLANTPDFAGAAWKPYQTEQKWVLAGGEGWRTVYIKTRDAAGRMTQLQDSIYLGAVLPASELTLDHASHVEDRFTLVGFTAPGYTRYSIALNWIGDDGDADFAGEDGPGSRTNDSDAVGGTAYRMHGGADRGSARHSSGEVHRNTPLLAFFRLKLDDAAGVQEVAELKIDNGVQTLAELTLRSTDFAASGRYLEFAVPFTYPADSRYPLYFHVARTGAAGLWWDTVQLFTPPARLAVPLTWLPPDRYWRSHQAWLRLWTPADLISAPVAAPPSGEGALFGAAATSVALLRVEGDAVTLYSPSPLTAPTPFLLQITCVFCGANGWQATGEPPWLVPEKRGDVLVIGADPVGIAAGTYSGRVIVSLPDHPAQPPVYVTVTLKVDPAFTQRSAYLPLVWK